jgi:hypothetical protein
MNVQDFKPRCQKVAIGELELEVQEYTLAKRDAVIGLFLRGLDAASIIRPFLDGVKAAKEGGDVVLDLTVIANQAVDILVRFLSKDLTTVACMTLDTNSNRKKVATYLGEPAFGQDVSSDVETAYTWSPSMFMWIKDNMTVRQEQQVIESVVETNDFGGLVKNYSTLVARMVKSAREKKETAGA